MAVVNFCLEFLRNTTDIIADFSEDILEDITDYIYHIDWINWGMIMNVCRLNRRTVNIILSGVALGILWILVKGIFFQFARRARRGLEETIATKVDLITSQFDDALSVSYRKATWELVKENVGVYALQGRRAGMEDRFTFVNQLEPSGTSIYGVFDGHGGEVSI